MLTGQIRNSIIILYILEKIDLPLPVSQLEQATLIHMDYFVFQETIHHLVDIKYIEGTAPRGDQGQDAQGEGAQLRYSPTDEGLQTLEYFERELAADVRASLNEFVLANHQRIKKDYESTSHFFKNFGTEDYSVKCALYDDDHLLMELNITVDSANQARLICDNWKANITKLYGNILENLIDTSYKDNTTE